MAVAKVILNGVTEIDLTNDSVIANKVLSGESFHLATGVPTVGTIGIQAAQTITPSATSQTIPSGIYLAGAQTIEPIPISVEGHCLILPEGLITV